MASGKIKADVTTEQGSYETTTFQSIPVVLVKLGTEPVGMIRYPSGAGSATIEGLALALAQATGRFGANISLEPTS